MLKMAVAGVNSGREKSVLNRVFNLYQSCFTHGDLKKRWGTVSSSVLQNEYKRKPSRQLHVQS